MGDKRALDGSVSRSDARIGHVSEGATARGKRLACQVAPHYTDADGPSSTSNAGMCAEGEVLGSSVLFIGYSLNDLNIRLVFYRLTEMWGRSALASTRPKSYVFTNRPNPVAQEVVSQWGIEMIVSDEDDRKKALTDFLEELVT